MRHRYHYAPSATSQLAKMIVVALVVGAILKIVGVL